MRRSEGRRLRRPADGVLDDAPVRLSPRPVTGPQPTPGQEAAFGRPDAVDGTFAGNRPTPPPRPLPPPPAEALLRAFGPPAAGSAACRTRPPAARTPPHRSGPWWKADARNDPWRDPYAPAGLGAPAVYDEDAQEGPIVVDAKGRKKLRLRDLNVRLVVLGLLAVLLVGAIGGGIGWFLTKKTSETPCSRPARSCPRSTRASPASPARCPTSRRA